MNRGLLLLLLGISAYADTERNALRTPVPVPGVMSATHAAIGMRFYLALLRDGRVLSWGERPGVATPRTQLVTVSGLPEIVDIAAGASHALAVGRDGSVWAWGNNGSGQLGTGPANQTRPDPVQVPGIHNAVAVAARNDASYALLADGRVLGWGDHLWLTGSRFFQTAKPTPVPGIAGATAIRAGLPCLALLRDGSVMAWGHGYLGDGSSFQMEYSATKGAQPVRVSGIDDAIAIAAGDSRSGVLRRDGSVWVWGKGDSGALGLGKARATEANGGDRLVPVRIPGLPAAADLSLAAGSAVGLADGTVRTWGDARLGATGRPGIEQLPQPTPVPAIHDLVRVWSVAYSNLGLTHDGHLLAWGSVVLPQP